MFLRQSTSSQEVLIGPFLDDTDGKTPETLLTILSTDIKIWKGGTTTLVNKNSGGATHVSGGVYSLVLDDVDTDTVGMMKIFVSIGGSLYVKEQPLQVVEEDIFDAYYAAGAKGYSAASDVGDTGLNFPKIIEMLAAFVSGQVSRSSAGGVTTLTYKKRDGTTTSFTTVANEDDGDRDTTGSLS
jgi:hypothetical protein